MNKLLILGSGGHGRCCLDIARSLNKYESIYFLDDASVGQHINDAEVIGKISDIESFDHNEYDVVVAVGNNDLRKKWMEEIREKGFLLATLISPKSNVSDYAQIKDGVVMYPGVCIEPNAYIGEGTILTSNVVINHDSKIGDFVIVYYNAIVRANVEIGDLSKIGNNCIISFGKEIAHNSDIIDGTIM